MLKKLIVKRKNIGTAELVFKDNNYDPPRENRWRPEISFEIGKCSCFVIRKNWRGKYYVRESEVWDYVYGNEGWCYSMIDGRIIPAIEYDKRIFSRDDLTRAKEVCSAKNGYKRVKVKKLRWWRKII